MRVHTSKQRNIVFHAKKGRDKIKRQKKGRGKKNKLFYFLTFLTFSPSFFCPILQFLLFLSFIHPFIHSFIHSRLVFSRSIILSGTTKEKKRKNSTLDVHTQQQKQTKQETEPNTRQSSLTLSYTHIQRCHHGTQKDSNQDHHGRT